MENINENELANQQYKLAATGMVDLQPPLFYNDHQPHHAYYKGLALVKCGHPEEAAEEFDRLIAYGETHLNDQLKLDFFAVSYPNLMVLKHDLVRDNNVHCYYLQALGWLGKKDLAKAMDFIQKGLEGSVYHVGLNVLQLLIKNHLSLLPVQPGRSVSAELIKQAE